MKIQTSDGEWWVEGTVFEPGSARLTAVDGVEIEVPLEGTLILIKNEDQPGVIGEVGTILGKAGVNIANFALGRGKGGAVGAVNIDVPALGGWQDRPRDRSDSRHPGGQVRVPGEVLLIFLKDEASDATGGAILHLDRVAPNRSHGVAAEHHAADFGHDRILTVAADHRRLHQDVAVPVFSESHQRQRHVRYHHLDRRRRERRDRGARRRADAGLRVRAGTRTGS